jgi:hypothetical protein
MSPVSLYDGLTDIDRDFSSIALMRLLPVPNRENRMASEVVSERGRSRLEIA